MSYAGSAALQQAVFGALESDAALAGLVGEAIHEEPPAGAMPPLWVTLGAESARERTSAGRLGSRHDFVVTVVSEDGGFARAKAAAGAVCDALDGSNPPLARGRVVAMSFVRARASRRGGTRRIDLTFRAFLDDL